MCTGRNTEVVHDWKDAGNDRLLTLRRADGHTFNVLLGSQGFEEVSSSEGADHESSPAEATVLSRPSRRDEGPTGDMALAAEVAAVKVASQEAKVLVEQKDLPPDLDAYAQAAGGQPEASDQHGQRLVGVEAPW